MLYMLETPISYSQAIFVTAEQINRAAEQITWAANNREVAISQVECYDKLTASNNNTFTDLKAEIFGTLLNSAKDGDAAVKAKIEEYMQNQKDAKCLAVQQLVSTLNSITLRDPTVAGCVSPSSDVSLVEIPVASIETGSSLERSGI